MNIPRSAIAAILWAIAPLWGAEGIEVEPPRCDGLRLVREDFPQAKAALPIPDRREFALRGQFCSEYSYAGWEKPLKLYLGEGAEEHADAVLTAAWLWNTALRGFRRESVIEIVSDARPRTFAPGSNVWSNSATADRNLADGQSVIYFTRAEIETDVGGFAIGQPSGGRMVQADVYINTREEEDSGYAAALAEPIMWTGTQGVIHSFVDPLYFKVAHELGHALGLQHVPVSGNIMSYNYMPAQREKWLPAAEFLELALDIGGHSEHLDILTASAVLPPVVRLTSEWELYMRQVFTRSMSAGEQDRMALMCIYDFEDWNH